MKITALSKDKFDKLLSEIGANAENVSTFKNKYFISISHPEVFEDVENQDGIDMLPLLRESRDNFLVLFFHDINADIAPFRAFNEDDGRKVLEFLGKIEDVENSELYVHCLMGSSRSVAVAEFAAEYFGQDPDWIEARIDRSANKHVLGILKELYNRKNI